MFLALFCEGVSGASPAYLVDTATPPLGAAVAAAFDAVLKSVAGSGCGAAMAGAEVGALAVMITCTGKSQGLCTEWKAFFHISLSICN